ncbi:MAG: iron uptake porin, partial [Cyanobacteriota bacterium]|nr:iron uptake porin [Cyanobacteriota bacterium]
MKLFQQLLVAPAALGLVAPMAAGAADLNLAGVSQYSSQEQVTSISQFSDVKPTDWAYQALSNLIERYGCVAGYPNGTYKGGQAMTRYEAAALLNACLDRISEVTDELRKLMAEFEKELAVLRGRVDGLEAKVGELESTRFSTTTKLSGQTTFVLGANSFSGSADGLVDGSRELYGATTFNYDLQLTFDTSFSGKDLLRTNLRAGNFAASSFGGAGPSSLSQLEVAFQEDLGNAAGGDVVAIDRLFYQFPLGDFTFSIGGRIGQEDMLAIWPSVYPAETVLDVLTLGGAPAAYNKNLGPGAGVWWQKNGF